MSVIGIGLLAVAIGLLVMIPTRRLFVAGFSSGVLTTYYAVTTGLGLLVAELRGPAKYLVPILVLAYVLPFIITRPGVSRWFRPSGSRASNASQRGRGAGAARGPVRPPMKNVTPPIEPSAGPTTGGVSEPAPTRAPRPASRFGRRVRRTAEEADRTRAG